MYQIGSFQYTFKKTPDSTCEPKKIFCKESIKISDGDLVVITGPSGAGKSTLLQLLKGIIPEYSSGIFEGEILYKNHSLSGDFFKENLKEILFLFQNPFSQLIYPNVAEEFFFSMENFNYSREQMDEKKNQLQQYFDIESLWNKKTNDLSNGECQRLVLSSLLAIDPKVLLLDEPTAFLDPQSRRDFYSWLTQSKGSRTIVLVDHHLDEILPFADLVIYVSKNGEVSLNRNKELREEKRNPLSLDQIKENNNLQLKVSQLNFHYKKQEKLLDNISISSFSGDIVVIKGKNGNGKSTLFKVIAGLLRGLKGEVELIKDGHIIPPKKHFKEMAFIYQNPESHFFYDTIKEELDLKNKLNKYNDLLEIFFKDIDLNRSPFMLSEGEKRKLSILMTIFQDKSVLFYDEPTFGQDFESISMIKEIILSLCNMGKIQFIISHDENFINSLPAKVYELTEAQLVRVK